MFYYVIDWHYTTKITYKRFLAGRYINELDQVVTGNIDFEATTTYIHDKIVDVAVLLSNSATNKSDRFTLELNKITSLEKIS